MRLGKRTMALAMVAMLLLPILSAVGLAAPGQVTINNTTFEIQTKKEDIEKHLPNGPQNLWDGQVWGAKSVSYDNAADNSTFNVTLGTLSQQFSNTTQGKPSDVLFVIDASASMRDGDKIAKVQQATKQAIKKLAEAGSENRAAIITFNAKIRVDTGYAKLDAAGIEKLYKAIDAISVPKAETGEGGTNMQLAFYSAQKRVLESGNDKMRQAVVFLSDGEPTYCYLGNLPGGTLIGNGNLQYAQAAGLNLFVQQTVNQAAKARAAIEDAFGPMLFYTVGVGMPKEGKQTLNPKDNKPAATQYVYKALIAQEKDQKLQGYLDQSFAGSNYGRVVLPTGAASLHIIGSDSSWLEAGSAKGRQSSNVPDGSGRYFVVGDNTYAATDGKDNGAVDKAHTPYKTTTLTGKYDYPDKYFDVTDDIAGAFDKIAQAITEEKGPLSSDVVMTDYLGAEFVLDVPEGKSVQQYLDAMAPIGTKAHYDEKEHAVVWTIPLAKVPKRPSEAYLSTLKNAQEVADAGPSAITMTFAVKLNGDSKTIANDVKYYTNKGATYAFLASSGNPYYAAKGANQCVQLYRSGVIVLGKGTPVSPKSVVEVRKSILNPAGNIMINGMPGMEFKVNLLKDGAIKYTFTLNAQNGWRMELTNVESGYYKIQEEASEGYNLIKYELVSQKGQHTMEGTILLIGKEGAISVNVVNQVEGNRPMPPTPIDPEGNTPPATGDGGMTLALLSLALLGLGALSCFVMGLRAKKD